MRLTSALLRYFGRFDSRVVVLAITALLLTFCLALSFETAAMAAGRN